jgi:LuxR family transcriptional regulator, activator of conjugal transfer of Ti plasmids
MHRIFQAFIDRLTESADAEALRECMAGTVAAFDLSCFAYLSVLRDQVAALQLISTYPTSWTSHYLQSHYGRLIV